MSVPWSLHSVHSPLHVQHEEHACMAYVPIGEEKNGWRNVSKQRTMLFPHAELGIQEKPDVCLGLWGVGEDGVCSLDAEKVRVEQEDQVEVTEVVIGWWENDVASTQVEKWKEGGSQSQELGEESDEKKASVRRMQESVTEAQKETLRSQTPAS